MNREWKMSTSIDARKYLGRNSVVLRSWDGYDKPEIVPLFKITEEELDFVGGRFKLHTYALKEVSQKFAIGVKHKAPRIEEIVNWISENVESFWYFDISEDYQDCSLDNEFYWHAWVFYFKSDEDCVKFTLRWM